MRRIWIVFDFDFDLFLGALRKPTEEGSSEDGVLAVRRRDWGPLVAYPPLMSYIFFTDALK
jgi:hypothetical protein